MGLGSARQSERWFGGSISGAGLVPSAAGLEHPRDELGFEPAPHCHLAARGGGTDLGRYGPGLGT